MIDRRRHNSMLHCQYRGDGFNCSRRTQKVTGHRFGRIYIDFVSVLSKDFFDGFCFCNISKWRRSSMHINGIDILNFQTCIFQTVQHHVFGSKSFRMWCCNVMGISRKSCACQFCIDRSTSCFCMFVLF